MQCSIGYKKFFVWRKKKFNFHRINCCSKKLKVIKLKEKRKTTSNEKNKAQSKQAIQCELVFYSYFIQIRENNIIQFDFVSDSYLCIVTKKFEWKFQT